MGCTGGHETNPKFLLISSYLNLFGFALFSPLYAPFTLRVGAGALQTGVAYGMYTGLAGLVILLFGEAEDRFADKRHLAVLGYFWLPGAALLFLRVKARLVCGAGRKRSRHRHAVPCLESYLRPRR